MKLFSLELVYDYCTLVQCIRIYFAVLCARVTSSLHKLKDRKKTCCALQTAAKAPSPFSDSHNPFHCWVLQCSSLISAVAVDLDVLRHRLEHLCALNNVNPKIKWEEGSIWTWLLDTSVCIYLLWCRLAETLNCKVPFHKCSCIMSSEEPNLCVNWFQMCMFPVMFQATVWQ